MPLSAGDKLGPYEILALIGKGGMGEVYRAHDARTGRDVAIKISAEQFSERFDREVRAVAALNHPNICTLFDVGPNYLVMEFIEGGQPQGPLPPEEALRIARQIAAALEEAHGKNIVHRDLKPANIKIKPDGAVKVLDFGLAKVAPASAGDSENSPTLSMAATQAGVILGTAAYMSPEQARGKRVDKRADIWAFGVVFYEILTGDHLFGGETIADTLIDVATKQPDWDRVPPNLLPLLKRCLEKDPNKRLRDIGDLDLLLVGQASGLSAPAAPAPLSVTAPSRSRLSWSVAALATVLLASLAFLHFRETPPPEHVFRYSIPAPENSGVHSFAISPDSRYVVIAAAVNGKQQLWLRPLDALKAEPMPNTEGATYPFWSPDSRFIGFFAEGKLKKIAASGGPSQALCDAGDGRGGSWNREDIIVFTPAPGGTAIQRVPAAGGVPADVTPTKGDYRHPVFLPDGRHFLYEVRGAPAGKGGIFVASLDGKENRQIVADVSSVVYAPPARGARTGHILFVRQNTLMAQPFDAAGAQVAGDIFPVAGEVSIATNGSYGPFTVSEDGVLLYLSGAAVGAITQIAFFDRTGKLLGPVGAPSILAFPALSPDEKTMAFTRQATNADLWLRDLIRETDARFTSDVSANLTPFWSAQGDRIVFASNRKGVLNLYQKASNGSGQDEPLLENVYNKFPSQWSRDGRFVVYSELDPKTKQDLWVVPVEGSAADRKPMPFLRTEFNEMMGQLSPDGHWMAYTSDQSGAREVYVRPFPPGEGQWKISIAGGEQPHWRGDGQELFFQAGDGKMMAVPVKAGAGAKSSFEAGTPVALFESHMSNVGTNVFYQYDVTKDGKRFLIATTAGAGSSSAPSLTVVVNWNAKK